jgi:hypothetical protein
VQNDLGIQGFVKLLLFEEGGVLHPVFQKSGGNQIFPEKCGPLGKRRGCLRNKHRKQRVSERHLPLHLPVLEIVCGLGVLMPLSQVIASKRPWACVAAGAFPGSVDIRCSYRQSILVLGLRPRVAPEFWWGP